MAPLEKYSCISCARRKVKCDKLRPCSNCSNGQSECVYTLPVPSLRHRKRPADGDLLAKLSEYEGLLREHNIKFEPLDNCWIPSPLEAKLASEPSKAQHPQTDSASPVQSHSEATRQLSKSRNESTLQSDLSGEVGEAARLWFALPKDLREPPIEILSRRGRDATDEPSERNKSSGLILLPVYLSPDPSLLELHPEPKHIFKLWQTFKENANPLTKVIHTPSLEQRILEVSWNLEAVSKPLEAVMFSVYALAIFSMNASDCVQVFNEARSVLLGRYRSAAAQALIAAGLHITRDLEVLQALVLLLLAEPRSESSLTATAVAMRIGQKMGLNQTAADPHKSFFEQEMGLRVWWQIRRLEMGARSLTPGIPRTRGDFGDIRLPLNVNDVELHPQMTGPPAAEHAGPTEMMFCMMKYEATHWTHRSLPVGTSPRDVIKSSTPEGMIQKRKLFTELKCVYEEKYISQCDPQIPLHRLTATAAHLTIYRAFFLGYQPRHQPEGGRNMSRADQDLLFESSVRVLELDLEARTSSFSVQLFEHIHGLRPPVDALVYMVSELRRRVSGDLVRRAWAHLRTVYEDRPELLQSDGKFFTALADLTLEAWEARRRELQKHEELEVIPRFIAALQVARTEICDSSVADTSTVTMEGMVPEGGTQFGLVYDEFVDWGSWNDSFQY